METCAPQVAELGSSGDWNHHSCVMAQQAVLELVGMGSSPASAATCCASQEARRLQWAEFLPRDFWGVLNEEL